MITILKAIDFVVILLSLGIWMWLTHSKVFAMEVQTCWERMWYIAGDPVVGPFYCFSILLMTYPWQEGLRFTCSDCWLCYWTFWTDATCIYKPSYVNWRFICCSVLPLYFEQPTHHTWVHVCKTLNLRTPPMSLEHFILWFIIVGVTFNSFSGFLV